MSYIGLKGVRNLDPYNLYDYEKAEQMLKQKYDPTVIKIQTGWEMGIDGYWRYEIADPFLPTSAIEDYVKPRFGQPINISMIVRDNTILIAYPELEQLTLFAMYSPQKSTAGYFNPSTGGMVVSMGTPSDCFQRQIEGVLLHELQHLIQQIENFAKGGSPKTVGRRKYIRLAGEVEARNICARHFLTNDERLHKLRTATQDIPDNEQIILSF